jgi:hypothetical protein
MQRNVLTNAGSFVPRANGFMLPIPQDDAEFDKDSDGKYDINDELFIHYNVQHVSVIRTSSLL